MSSVLFPLFGKEDKKKMLGSPKHKRNFNISPTKNREAKRYKHSRGNSKERLKKNTNILLNFQK